MADSGDPILGKDGKPILGKGEKLLDANEAAELLGLSPKTISRMAWQRRIRSFKVLGSVRFKRSDLEEIIVERPAQEKK